MTDIIRCPKCGSTNILVSTKCCFADNLGKSEIVNACYRYNSDMESFLFEHSDPITARIERDMIMEDEAFNRAWCEDCEDFSDRLTTDMREKFNIYQTKQMEDCLNPLYENMIQIDIRAEVACKSCGKFALEYIESIEKEEHYFKCGFCGENHIIRFYELDLEELNND